MGVVGDLWGRTKIGELYVLGGKNQEYLREICGKEKKICLRVRLGGIITA